MGGMCRHRVLASLSVVLALALCAINFSVLARRTVSSSAHYDGGAESEALDIPVENVKVSASSAGSAPSDRRTIRAMTNNVSTPASPSGLSIEAEEKETSSPPEECFRARKHTIPPSLYGNLSLPFINLGFPKSGTTSIHGFFGCAGYRAAHYRCKQKVSCAECMVESVRLGLPPLKKCGIYDVYGQVDGRLEKRGPMEKLYFPQIELLEEIVRGYPNATFYIPFRSMKKWHHSITNWPPGEGMLKLDMQMYFANITGLPRGKGANLQEFSEFFCNHVERVRRLVPSHRLVEIDMEDPTIASRMAEIFNLDEGCWGHANANTNLHPELKLNNTTKGVPWFIRGKTMLRGKYGVMRPRRILPPFLPRVGNITQRNSTGVAVSAIEHPMASINISGLIASAKPTVEQSKARHDESTAWAESCQQITDHERGHWQHHVYPGEDMSMLSEPQIQRQYFPEEIGWMMGQRLPQNFAKCTPSSKFLMYNSILGHQCGCGVKGFAPSYSVWAHNRTNTKSTAQTHRNQPYFDASPTLRLARQLADTNATLCFSGDSIDYQIYSAFHNNLRRMDQLHRLHHPGKGGIVDVVTREIKVTHRYHTKPGNVDDWFLHGHRPPNGDGSFLNARRPPAGGFGSMYSILETKAHFRDDGRVKRGRIRYYMSYGWSPWNLDLMEDCNVVVLSMDFHYSPDGDNVGRETRHPLLDDTRAAITFLSNFTSSDEKRVAVWRSALPQHFATKDGHFRGRKSLPKDHSCAAISQHSHQNYNRAHAKAFSHMCEPLQPCGHLRHSCTVDPAANVDYQTLFTFWRDNNCTEDIERERLRLNRSSVTGTIYRWNIFDDCSHTCYVPELYEAAFERLLLLLSPSLASFRHKPQ